ncbi:ApeA N-terminal domain 1-containing protein [Streptomyces phaeochromogenes]|uniref:ApeA N-terminal domain 1-containing protein n=1 Tax=Streptomyces phaeochromogenes TaxID=1923 RepID=UPI002E0EE163|nr:hypothetical protein OG437_17175 [Streptomyces phaeochromogenes]
MKKLPISSDEYQCTWVVDGVNVAGTLELAGGKSPRGEIFDIPGEWWTPSENSEESGYHTFSPHIRKFPELRGRLRTNHEVVLIDAQISFLFPGEARIFARMALCGLELTDDSQSFDSVEFQVGGLTELSGHRPLKEMRFPNTYTPDMEFSVKWNVEADQTWCAGTDEEISLKFAPYTKFDRGYSYSVSPYPVITVKGGPRTAEKWLEEYVRPLSQITQFATTQQQPISWVLLDIQGEAHKTVQVFAREISQEPYTAGSPYAGGITTLLRVGPNNVSLAKLLKDWRSIQAGQDVFFEYLTISLTDDRSLESRFLAVIPSLESYHSVKYGLGPIDSKEFKKHRRGVIKRIKEAEGVTTDDAEWLDKWVSTLGTYELRDRLSRLFSDLPEELQQRIRLKIDPLPEVLNGIIQNSQDVWHIMGKVRNNLAHGGKRPTVNQLATLNRLAHTMAVSLALQDLNLPEKALIDSIDRGDWPIL